MPDFVGAGSKANQWHEVCQVRFSYVDKVLVCPSCGYRKSEEENKPKARLVSVVDGAGMLVQPKKEKKEPDDLPPGATIIQEVNLGPA